MRPLIGLSINGLLKRSLFGRADERRGEMDEEGIGRHDAGAHGFSMGYNYNGRLSTPPENPMATRPYAKSSCSSADSLS